MKKIFGKVAIIVALFATVMVFVAGISGDYGTLSRLIISGRLTMKSAAYTFFNGTSYLAMGDSAYISVGGRIADTSAFSGALLTKAIYISGATPSDVYFISKRTLASAVTTAALADSSILSYEAITDSVIVKRAPIGLVIPSGEKFSWIRVKLR